MKCVMVMFDSLNRHMLSPYGCVWTHTPNFGRLANRATTFDRSYVCSMPCMPARRDLHTGRPGFLHRGWGPLEPFDVSVFDLLREQQGAYSHLATDHYHYFEDGGANYHPRYDSWEFFRGQEGDPWIGHVAEPAAPQNKNARGNRNYWINRPHLSPDERHCQTLTFDAGVRFLDRNATEDNWLLQIECFDPHEPFFVGEEWQAMFPSPDAGEPLYDWPGYGEAPDDPKLVDQARRRYAALLAKCDASLGRVLDAFDRHDLWGDTMLVVWTDHGIMLGEHGQMMKNEMPLYEQISHTPLLIHDPRHPGPGRRSALVQPAIDLAPTLLSFFGGEPDELVTGCDLTPVLAEDAAVRDAALFGYHGKGVNLVTDQHVYHRAPIAGQPRPDAYTLSLARMVGNLPPDRQRLAMPAEPTAATRGVVTLRVPDPAVHGAEPSLLFDLQEDPAEDHPLDEPDLENRLAIRMAELMGELDAPPEQFARLGLSARFARPVTRKSSRAST